MTIDRNKSTNDLREALPHLTKEQLFAELQLAFSYYGNALACQDSERSDDAIVRFEAIKNEIATRMIPLQSR